MIVSSAPYYYCLGNVAGRATRHTSRFAPVCAVCGEALTIYHLTTFAS